MKISFDQFNEAVDGYSGYCTYCGKITTSSGVEPDAQGYHCEECGNDKVIGMEQALLYEHIQITEDEEEE